MLGGSHMQGRCQLLHTSAVLLTIGLAVGIRTPSAWPQNQPLPPWTLRLENPPFDPNKPTVVYFGGGRCVGGYPRQKWGAWHELANVLGFPSGYRPDAVGGEPWRTYYRYGDEIFLYLSAVAPEYKQPIQMIGWSTGGQPAVDAAIRLNSYGDRRYAVNRVTEIDAFCRWQLQGMEVYVASNALLAESVIPGEPFLHEHYWGEDYTLTGLVPAGVLGVYVEGYDHAGVLGWYRDSLANELATDFNSGVVAGAYWSVVGPGKNLTLTAEEPGYHFRWRDGEGMTLFDQLTFPGRLPEPLTLVEPFTLPDVEGVILTCTESTNAVAYELLLGVDPQGLEDFIVVSETPEPPAEPVSSLPVDAQWWTIRVRDANGSTIFADPIPIGLPLQLQPVAVEKALVREPVSKKNHAALVGLGHERRCRDRLQ